MVAPKLPVVAEQTDTHVTSPALVNTYYYLWALRHSYLRPPKVLLFWPKEKLVLGAEDPKRPVVALDVAVAWPKRLPVPGAIGLVGPFLPAW